MKHFHCMTEYLSRSQVITMVEREIGSIRSLLSNLKSTPKGTVAFSNEQDFRLNQRSSLMKTF